MFGTRTLALTLAAALTGCGSSDAPDAVMKRVLNDLAAGKPRTVWDQLPTRYQNDVKQALTKFADKLDPRLYERGVKLARRFIAAARDKRELAFENLPPFFPRESIELFWDSALDLVDELCAGEFATVDRIRKLDVGRVLDALGGYVVTMLDTASEMTGQDMTDMLRSIRVEVTRSSSTRATLRMSAPNQPRPESFDVVLVDGRWVPEQVQMGWSMAMAQLSMAIEQMPSMKDPAQQEKIELELSRAEAQVEAFEQADTSDELKRLLEMTSRPPK